MNYSLLHEDKKRGTFDFPIELYYVDSSYPRYQMPLHWHLEYELILVLSGSLHLSIGGKQYLLEEGDSAWISDGAIHGGEPENCVYECVVFDLAALIRDTPLCTKSAKEFLTHSNSYSGKLKKGSICAQLADKIFEAMEKEQNGYEWVTIGLLWQLMGNMLKNNNIVGSDYNQSRQQITKLKTVLAYIRDNYEAQITLEELAQLAGMSPRYFCRAFSAMTGKTPIAYLNYYRIECAGEFLKLTDKTITEIAISCGFSDMSYFSKQFKRYKNLTPSQYRKSNFY
ncbi:MAG: AraC family transcriptional regulator [Acetobacter sp.]|nr:AraC family transcriptional regulator [Bacteroides sp.]MCM1340172.1 AraC family transcriptional regulator [Acetobacter sp.]MCM1432876.1 AraC family transcriptional regulator [Clostridiales bacterium]